jgi:hypothetical protein
MTRLIPSLTVYFVIYFDLMILDWTDSPKTLESIRSKLEAKKPGAKALGISGKIGKVEINSLLNQYSGLIYSGNSFDDSILELLRPCRGNYDVN